MLSVCIITKNEEKNLEKCLKSIKQYGFEIIVTDTGSTDHSREIAEKYADKVYDFLWCDDFSAAKNFSVSKASNDMVMVIDSDEEIIDIDMEQLKKLILCEKGRVGRIKRINTGLSGDSNASMQERINRIFSKSLYGYVGKIHEQVVKSGGKIDDIVETYNAPVTINHTGYAGSREELKNKALRNIKLLLEEYKENPEDTYIIYQIGKGYYMYGDYEKAIEYFNKAFEIDINPKLEYVIDMIVTYGYSLLNSGRAAEALLLEGVYNDFSGTADFVFLMGLIYMNNHMFEEAVCEFEKATKIDDEHTYNTGANSYLAYYNAGVIRECLGMKEEAAKYYKKCGDYEKARKQLSGLEKTD